MHLRCILLGVLTFAACVPAGNEGEGEAPDGGPDEQDDSAVDVDVRVAQDFVFVYARERSLTCDCQDGTFPSVDVCTVSSDVGQCACPASFPVFTAPCLDRIRATVLSPSGETRELELQGGPVAGIGTTVLGVDPRRENITLHVEGCGASVDVPLPLLAERGPAVERAVRVAGGVSLELASPTGAVLFEGGQCGVADGEAILIEDAWVDDEAFFVASVAARTQVGAVDAAPFSVRIWHDRRQMSRVVETELNDDGTLTLSERRTSIEIERADGTSASLSGSMTVLASAEGTLLSGDALMDNPTSAPEGLEVSATRLTFRDEAVDVELVIDGVVFTGSTSEPIVSTELFAAEGFQFFSTTDTLTLVDEEGVAPPIEATQFGIRHFSRDVFVRAIE